MRRPARESGFTLLELLLVCALIAIMAGLVAPALSGSNARARLDAMARAIVAFARSARARASADGRAYFLIVDQQAKQVRLARQRDPLLAPEAEGDAETDGDAWVGGAPWARAYDFPEDVTCNYAATTYQDIQTSTTSSGGSSGSTSATPTTTGTSFGLPGTNVPVYVQTTVDATKPARVAFNPDGTSDDATFDLVGQDGDKVRVIIDSPSGRARILTGQELDDALQAQAQAGSTSTGAGTPPAVLGSVLPLPSPAPGGR